jgi:hypothetical protein
MTTFDLRVVVAVGHRVRGEAAEDDRVRRADAGAGEHRDGRLGDHRHVDRDAVAPGHAQRRQRVGEFADFAVELLVRQRAAVARLALEDDRGLVAVLGEVPVEAIDAGVDRAAHEPLRVGGVRPVEHLRPGLEPVERLGLLRPEAVRVAARPLGEAVALGRVHVCLRGELRRGRELPRLLQDARNILVGARGGHARFL